MATATLETPAIRDETIENEKIRDEKVRPFRFSARQFEVLREMSWLQADDDWTIEIWDGEVWERSLGPDTAPRRYRFSCEQYEQLGELGWFDEVRVQLLDGVIFEMSPMGSRHAAITGHIGERLQRAFSMGFSVRIQSPLRMTELDDEPEPDVAVVRGALLDYLEAHPVTAVLVVEVAESTRRTDRVRKAQIYAAANIQEYWIANLHSNQLEVHRNPVRDRRGACYEDKNFYTREQSVAPLAATDQQIKVADLLP